MCCGGVQDRVAAQSDRTTRGSLSAGELLSEGGRSLCANHICLIRDLNISEDS
jgi:hypothetical protein